MPNTVEYKDWLFVKADNFENAEIHNGILYYLGTGGQSIRSRLQLPPGSWQIIGKGDRIDWDGIVESHEFANKDNWARTDLWYKDYETKEYKWLATPTESGLSMLRSLEMEPGTTLVLKKNEK